MSSPTTSSYGILESPELAKDHNRCKEVITKGNPNPDNPIGYVQKALQEFWQFKDRRAKQSFDIATPSVEATRALIDDLKATWAEKQNPTAAEMAKIDAMLINAGLKAPPKFD